jgi:hypothetical protein
MILALDLGLRTGWAVLMTDGVIESGIQTFDLKRGESPGIRFLRFNAWLTLWLQGCRWCTAYNKRHSDTCPGWGKELPPKLVIWEAAHHRGGAATELAVGFATRIQEQCALREIPYAAVHSATLKKHATGSGRSDKRAMVAAAQRKLGYTGSDDNEADARWLLDYARQTLSPAA